MTKEKSKDPLQGVTLERILIELQAQYGWETLAEKNRYPLFQGKSVSHVEPQILATNSLGQE